MRAGLSKINTVNECVFDAFPGALQICPKAEPEADAESVSEMLDTSLTPAALKKFSVSISDLTDISRSTASVFTDGGKLLKWKGGGGKGDSAASVLTETTTVGSVESVGVSIALRLLFPGKRGQCVHCGFGGGWSLG